MNDVERRIVDALEATSPTLCAIVREQDTEIERLHGVFADLLKDWQGLVDHSETIGDGARDGVRICIKMLRKAVPSLGRG